MITKIISLELKRAGTQKWVITKYILFGIIPIWITKEQLTY